MVLLGAGDLIGEPSLLDWSTDSGRSTVPALRNALMDYRQITPLLGGAQPAPPPNLDALAHNVGQVWDAYQDSRYGYLTSRLASLLVEAQSAGRAYLGEGRERATSLLAMTHQAAAMILTKLGETDLAWIAADRGLVTTQDSDRVPLEGVVPREWRDAVVDDKDRVERIPYELCVLKALREAIRRREIWGVGANRWRNPDELVRISV